MSLKLPDNRAEFSHKVASLYQERREAATLRGEQKRRLALAESPRLRDADLALRAAGAKQLSASFGGGEKLARAQEAMSEARERRNAILKELGFDERFDQPDYSCRYCEDTGTVDGKPCRCFAETVYPILLDESQLRPYAEQTFERFREDLFNDRPEKGEKPGMLSSREMHVRLRDAMLKYCRDFETETAKSYFFHGRTGTGKTFIATSIGHDLLRRGHSVYFLSFSEMMQQLQQYRILTSSFNPDPIRLEQAERFYQQIHTTDLLILDDLGSGIGDGGIHASELLGLMNSRFSQKKPMLITTNLDTAKILKLYDERLLSRLLGSFVPVYFYGEDVRTIRRRR